MNPYLGSSFDSISKSLLATIHNSQRKNTTIDCQAAIKLYTAESGNGKEVQKESSRNTLQQGGGTRANRLIVQLIMLAVLPYELVQVQYRGIDSQNEYARYLFQGSIDVVKYQRYSHKLRFTILGLAS